MIAATIKAFTMLLLTFGVCAVEMESEIQTVTGQVELRSVLQEHPGSTMWDTIISLDRVTDQLVYSRDSMEHFLNQSAAPFYSHVIVGNPKDVMHCERGIRVVAVARANGSGTDLFFDMGGGNLGAAHDSEELGAILAIGACISSSPLVLVDSTLNDDTLTLASRIAAHLLDQSSANKGASCSFREGGPALAIVVNKNDWAVRQEAQPGGLRAVWDKLAAARSPEASVINHVFKDVKLFALPHGGNEGIRRDPDGALWHKLKAVDRQLMIAALPVTLLSESDSEVRYEATPATIASAVENIITRFHTSARARFFASPRARETAAREAAAAASACFQEFNTTVSAAFTLACGVGHEGAMLGSLGPARSAAEKCFALGAAEWRACGDPLIADMVNHRRHELLDRIHRREEELRRAWVQGSRGDTWERCSDRYGPRCHPLSSKRKYIDVCLYRCQKEFRREQRHMC